MEQCEELLTEQLEPLLHDNQHDRIAAGLAMGVALLFTDTQARGESLLRDLLASQPDTVSPGCPHGPNNAKTAE